ncbi:cutinase family protein [Rhodococcus sp. BP-252]|uniref:cutinase family protein n=1 Tax=unclassified Rhodococcus (in: high G+C Gram-positive bacteria) TaxID=192944 RepID=UPI001C9A30C8|nr:MULTISPECIES: cutinase family protein [unclassified Rhodococcus (in: high G+C Gram-positive bacteria)]MBY6411840.1 cutinase family protein [Rhodococcus sp. BP-320]MBY6416532.1 cutinase family protein [Rhodococcus sp. BP-321]MBY6420662.1 cutinase family protein [Rhodococcus sp. BP-324]MBY6426556.1 cutinase family protein [Rhodococcus sp. BP-323]MBY6431555.1 cutinase family protein [Rhodococcus sp. BP-322]
MGIRSPRKTRRLITSAVAFVSLGALAVGAAVLTTDTLSSSDAEVELASTATCYDMVSIAIGGRGDTPSNSATKFLTTPDGTALPAALAGDFESDWIDQMVGAPNDAVKQGSYAAVYIDYPANLATYETAVDTGVQNAQTVMKAIVASCPKTRFAIVGYSEGADVTRRTAMEIGNQVADDNGKYGIVDPSQVVGVVILADAGREDGDNPFPGSKTGTNPDNFDTKYQNNASGPAGAGALPGTAGSFGALDGKVASFCSQKDLTCAMPQNTSLLHLAANVGRQLDVDAIQRDNTVTPATGADMAMVIGRIAGLAFMDIASQDNWLAGDETFLQVLIKVSEPGYTPPDPTTKVSAKTDTEEGTDPTEEPLPADKAVNLAYLPSKIVKEIVGLIGSNTDTVPVLMNDPYGQTLGPGSGAHFDYWRDADASNGRPLTSAQYAAAWLTQLAKDAEAGKPIKSAEVQQKALLVAQSATPAPTTTSAAPVASGASVQPVAPAAPAPLAAVPAAPAEVAPAAPVEGAPAPGLPVESAPAVVTETPAAPSTTEAPVTTSVAPTTTATPTP